MKILVDTSNRRLRENDANTSRRDSTHFSFKFSRATDFYRRRQSTDSPDQNPVLLD